MAFSQNPSAPESYDTPYWQNLRAQRQLPVTIEADAGAGGSREEAQKIGDPQVATTGSGRKEQVEASRRQEEIGTVNEAFIHMQQLGMDIWEEEQKEKTDELDDKNKPRYSQRQVDNLMWGIIAFIAFLIFSIWVYSHSYGSSPDF